MGEGVRDATEPDTDIYLPDRTRLLSGAAAAAAMRWRPAGGACQEPHNPCRERIVDADRESRPCVVSPMWPRWPCRSHAAGSAISVRRWGRRGRESGTLIARVSWGSFVAWDDCPEWEARDRGGGVRLHVLDIPAKRNGTVCEYGDGCGRCGWDSVCLYHEGSDMEMLVADPRLSPCYAHGYPHIVDNPPCYPQSYPQNVDNSRFSIHIAESERVARLDCG